MFRPNWQGLPNQVLPVEFQTSFYVFESKFAMHYSAIVQIASYVAQSLKKQSIVKLINKN